MRRMVTWMVAFCVGAAVVPSSAGAFQFLAKWGGTGSGDGQLNQPYDMAVNPATGHQYVADHDNNRIVEFDPNGSFVREWGSGGPGDNQFNGPVGVGLDAEGNVWVADHLNNRVKKFDSNGNLLAVFGTTGTGPGQVSEPSDVAVDSAGNFYEAEEGGRVQKFTRDGTFVRQWAALNPTGIAISGSNLYVVNYNNDNAQIFDLDGNPLGSFGGSGTGGAQFNQPWHLGIDASGRLSVADRANNRVQVLDPAGGFIETFGWGVATGASAFEVCMTACQAGIFGSGDGQFGSTAGVGIDCRGNVYVTDQSNGFVQKFGEPGTRNPPCPSNDFSFGKVKKNKHRGTAKLAVNVPGPGVLALSGKGLKHLQAKAASGRAVQLLIKAKGKKSAGLDVSGHVKVKPKVTFTPTNGDPNTKATKIKLVKRP